MTTDCPQCVREFGLCDFHANTDETTTREESGRLAQIMRRMADLIEAAPVVLREGDRGVSYVDGDAHLTVRLERLTRDEAATIANE